MYKKPVCPKCKSDNVIAKSRSDTYEGWLHGRYSAYCCRCFYLDGFFETEYEALQLWVLKEDEKRNMINDPSKIPIIQKLTIFPADDPNNSFSGKKIPLFRRIRNVFISRKPLDNDIINIKRSTLWERIKYFFNEDSKYRKKWILNEKLGIIVTSKSFNDPGNGKDTPIQEDVPNTGRYEEY